MLTYDFYLTAMSPHPVFVVVPASSVPAYVPRPMFYARIYPPLRPVSLGRVLPTHAPSSFPPLFCCGFSVRGFSVRGFSVQRTVPILRPPDNPDRYLTTPTVHGFPIPWASENPGYTRKERPLATLRDKTRRPVCRLRYPQSTCILETLPL